MSDQRQPYPRDWRAHIIRIIKPVVDGDQVTDKDYVDAAIASAMTGLHWQEAVLDRFDPTGGLPADVAGNRYISTATANGWTVDYIYEGTGGSGFTETIPTEGFCLTVEDEDAVYYYNDAANWVKFGNIIDHANLSNVTSDQHHAQLHAASHKDGGGDELDVEEFATSETDFLKALRVSKLTAGSVEFIDVPIKGIVTGIGNNPPGVPAAGEMWLVSNAPTGAWVGHAEELAIYDGVSAWNFYTPTDGDTYYSINEGNYYVCSTAAWSLLWTLASHNNLQNITANQHHTEAHQIQVSGGPHTGTLPEGEVTFDDATGHKHTGAAGSGTPVDHSDTAGQTTDDHHAQIHAPSHKDGGGDELDVSELAGALGGAGEIPETDGAAVTWVDPDGRYDPKAHAASHKDGGADELDVSELAGALGGAGEIAETDGAAVAWVDPDGRYDPKAHKDSHDPEDGSDPLDAAAPGSIDETANAEGSAHSFARSDHNHQHTAALHENGGGAEISVTDLSGLLADDQHVLDSEVKLAVQYQPDVSPLAGATPVDADVAGWTAGDRGFGIGTTSRVFLMYKQGTAVRYVELS